MGNANSYNLRNKCFHLVFCCSIIVPTIWEFCFVFFVVFFFFFLLLFFVCVCVFFLFCFFCLFFCLFFFLWGGGRRVGVQPETEQHIVKFVWPYLCNLHQIKKLKKKSKGEFPFTSWVYVCDPCKWKVPGVPVSRDSSSITGW